jgi:hypothetical protein
MTAAKRSPRVGTQMKPRGEHKEEAQVEKDASADAVQDQGANEPEKTSESEPETPPSQGAEMAEKQQESSRLSPVSSSEELRAMMGTKNDETPQPDEGTYHFDSSAKPGGYDIPREDLERAMAEGKKAAAGFEVKVEDDKVKIYAPTPEEAEKYGAWLNRNAGPAVSRVGPQPNGDLGVVIAIPEYYVTSVKDFAESDGGKDVQQWCTEFFIQHLEAYCTPVKGR